MRYFEKKQFDWSKKRLFRSGFTLVELSLSMAFIGVLSIIIVFVINGAVSSYRRGITLNLVNTVGTEVTEEIKTTVHKAPMIMSFESLCRGVYGDGSGKGKCLDYNGAGLIAVSQIGNIYKNEDIIFEDVPVYGAVCLGNYSYIWNSGYFFNSDYKVKLQNLDEASMGLSFGVKEDNRPGSPLKEIWEKEKAGRLLRVKDEKRAVCRDLINLSGDGLTSFSYFNSEAESSDINDSILFTLDNGFDIGEDVAEILTNESKVAVYGFDVETPAIGDGTLYNLSITLGTIDSGININDENCKVSGGANDLDFCAINKFNITALASGGRKND